VPELYAIGREILTAYPENNGKIELDQQRVPWDTASVPQTKVASTEEQLTGG